MATFTFTVETVGEDVQTVEDVARVLRATANRMANGDEVTLVLDANGNTVGTVSVTD
jgi:hypothetical protein